MRVLPPLPRGRAQSAPEAAATSLACPTSTCSEIWREEKWPQTKKTACELESRNPLRVSHSIYAAKALGDGEVLVLTAAIEAPQICRASRASLTSGALKRGEVPSEELKVCSRFARDSFQEFSHVTMLPTLSSWPDKLEEVRV